MSIEVGIWRLENSKAEKIDFTAIDAESRLEDILADDISIINPNLLVIGRQVPTAYGKFIDLLAIDADGNLVIIELKRNRTPREVVAQLLDYGCWVRGLQDENIAGIFDSYHKKINPCQRSISLDQVFCEKFGVKEMPESLNKSHEMLLVAGQLDDSTERIIAYLSEYHGVSINAIFFRFFKDSSREFLSRAWMIDPIQEDISPENSSGKLAWNGEYYVSFGGTYREWEEACKYGFISAGGGTWYSRTLNSLEIGARVWVNIPKGIGYVGVGEVLDNPVPIDEFKVDNGKGEFVSITSLPLKISQSTTRAQDPDKAEYMVRVKWIKTVSTGEAVKERGLFGSTNSVAKPRVKKWTYTIERLKTRFGIEE